MLFEIKDLSDVIELKVCVEKEELSIDVFQFYFHSIELIQNFLLIKLWITEERSKYLASVFARMHFYRVDQIQLLYYYQDTMLRKAICDAYVDERAGRFYILKAFEKSEIRYIETMAKFIIQDRPALAELTSFMKDLFRIYQNEGEQGLIRRYESINTQQDEHRWILPNVYVAPSTQPSVESSSDDKPIVISNEMIEQVMNESLPERKPRSQITTKKDEQKNPLCFPARANTNETTELSKTKTHSTEQQHSQCPSNGSSSHSSASSTSISKISKKSDLQIDSDTSKSTETSKVQQHAATIDYSNSSSVEVTKFRKVQISRLAGSNSYPLCPSSITIEPTGNTVEDGIGRLGEDVVFRYLQWKYPKAHVKWMNAERESGRPYDIQMEINNQIELIEVKTTRIQDQHTFQISFSELKCLFDNPMNYHIYRVYYSDELESTKITILDRVKEHLEHKQLALCMTIMQRADLN